MSLSDAHSRILAQMVEEKRWRETVARWGQGVSKSLEQQYAHIETDPKHANEIAVYRKAVLAADLGDRLSVMLNLLETRRPSRRVFWDVIEHLWSVTVLINHPASSQETQERILALMRPMHEPVDGEPIRVFRGCERSRVLSTTWTTELRIAEWYARNKGVTDPVVAGAIIPARGVFMHLPTGEVGDVLLDPHELQDVVVKSAQ